MVIAPAVQAVAFALVILPRATWATPTPPNLPPDFTVEREVKAFDFGPGPTLIEFDTLDYDYSGNRARMRGQTNLDPEPNAWLMTPEPGFDLVFTYRPNMCNIEKIDSKTKSFVDSTGQLRTFWRLYGVQSGATPIYKGTQTIRNFETKVWTYQDRSRSIFSDGDILSTFYLSNSSSEGFDVPLRANITYEATGYSEQIIMEFLNWRIGRPKEEAFDRLALSEEFRAVCPTWRFPSTSVHRPIPLLPDSFSSRIEANIVERNYSLERRDYYDAPKSRIGQTTHTPSGGTRTTITTYDTAKQAVVTKTYSVENGMCNITSKEFPAQGGNFFFNATNAHLFHTAFFFGEGGNFSYEGVSSCRGIPSNVFRTSTSFSGVLNQTINYTLTYYFSASPPWVFVGDNAGLLPTTIRETVPVRARLDGNDAIRGPFRHFYDFIDFIPASPPASTFAPPPECVEPVIPPVENCSCNCKCEDCGEVRRNAMAGTAAGVILSLLAAFPLGMWAGWAYRKRKEPKGQNNSQMEMKNGGGDGSVIENTSKAGQYPELGDDD
ncbi:hypothetical protein AAMO2058_000672800 [Amorphochlora amoebiformis]